METLLFYYPLYQIKLALPSELAIQGSLIYEEREEKEHT